QGNAEAPLVVAVLDQPAQHQRLAGADRHPSADLTLKELPWQLYIDGKQTISGSIRKEIAIPGGQTSAPIPIEIEVDLTKVITDRGYDELMSLALSIGGVNAEPTKLMVEATPVVNTPFGVWKSPSPIRIVNTEFRSR
ncbi:MAG: hypothetical protein ACK47W_01335, partial [Bacteroidota bacterium]